ncbi:uncharacterized protein LOC121052115 isoform X2 [Rosa chinensis]|uniref:uncharacterized protein LOC121052115 isoform X2 n=1 Tax=Rosa chinensis TaxID=74649 RepID=UPI001AD8B05E|nr:uncharacterized protein LOC121052115 isoform X2 [Rosa chinensis]
MQKLRIGISYVPVVSDYTCTEQRRRIDDERPELSPETSANSGDSGHRLDCMWYGTHSSHRALHSSIIKFLIWSSFDNFVSGFTSVPSLSSTPATFPWLGFGLDCNCRQDICSLLGWITSTSSVHHHLSLGSVLGSISVGFRRTPVTRGTEGLVMLKCNAY